MIRIPQVRVVDEEGAQLGVMPTPQALAMAQERGLDLVEVAPLAAPPVVKFLDFGQYKYELTKREKENKRRQRSVTFKEVRLSPKIGTGDFDTKVHRAIEFLEDGDRIKVTVRFRGRELTHPELGRNLIARFVDRVKEHGVAERTPLLEGKSMHITMASLHKPKTHDAPAPRGAEASEPKTEAAPATGADTKPTTAVETEPTTTLYHTGNAVDVNHAFVKFFWWSVHFRAAWTTTTAVTAGATIVTTALRAAAIALLRSGRCSWCSIFSHD